MNILYLFMSFGGKSGKSLLNFDGYPQSYTIIDIKYNCIQWKLFKVSYNKYV